MANPNFIKSMACAAAIAGRRVVAVGASDFAAVTASAVSSPAIGISEQIGSRLNDTVVDVILSGTAEAVAGGTITRGDRLTSNGSGAVITSTAETDRIVGVALQSAVSGDIINVLIALR